MSKEDFKYGDLIVKCHQCGGIQVIEPLVTDGRAIYLFNKEDSYLQLHCPVCKITLEMAIVPTEIVEEVKDEELSEVSPEEEVI